MTWLVWRQHRKQALFALLALAALAAVLVPTGLQVHDAFDRAGLDDCLPAAARVEFVPVNPGPGQPPDPVRACQERADEFAGRFGSRGTFGVLLWFLPLLAGLFWGAPLIAREVEHGTHRLVWTQGVSRLRWALVKFGLVGAGVVVAAACYALLVTWWRAPLDQAAGGTATGNRFGFGLFDVEGLVPVGYALFAVALGVFAGALTRRTQAAMAVTLVGTWPRGCWWSSWPVPASWPRCGAPIRSSAAWRPTRSPATGSSRRGSTTRGAPGSRAGASGTTPAPSARRPPRSPPHRPPPTRACSSTARAPTTCSCSTPRTATGCSRASRPPCSSPWRAAAAGRRPLGPAPDHLRPA
jgi:hypothetical protein